MTVVILATLGGATEIGLFLSFVASPKVAKASTVACNCRWHYRTKLCQCKDNFNLISFQFCCLLNINFSLLLALSCAQRHLQHFIRCLWLCRSKCACFIVIATVFEMKKKIITKNYFWRKKILISTFFFFFFLPPFLTCLLSLPFFLDASSNPRTCISVFFCVSLTANASVEPNQNFLNSVSSTVSKCKSSVKGFS